jgi:three-Cys-motif partner protein
MDINRNVLWTNPEAVSAEQKIRLNRLWGEDWRKSVYVQTPTLFGNEEEKVRNEVVAEAFRRRLKTVAGFKFVPKPIAMRNSRGAVLFYLFFASQKEVAEKIARDIFNKYRKRT